MHKQITDIMGTELKAVEIEYKGEQIPFQYQIWKVRDQSVCSNVKHDVSKYSSCSIKASELFSELCTELSKKTARNLPKTKNMYCNAAVSFKPTIAQISAAPKNTTLKLARTKCNLAISATMGDSDPVLAKERDVACNAYKKLKLN
jgi:hypothetical protein